MRTGGAQTADWLVRKLDGDSLRLSLWAHVDIMVRWREGFWGPRSM
jgi:hypothetical protein